jgi:hypothetical protein
MLDSTFKQRCAEHAMRFDLVHVSVEVGYAWMLLNLAILVYVTVHFCAERAWCVWRRRRMARATRPSNVVFIAPR